MRTAGAAVILVRAQALVMRGFQQNYDVIIRAAGGDPSAQEAAMDLFLHGVRVWLRLNGELSLDRCLNLPPPSAKSKLAKLKRDYWLTVAHGLCDGDSPWHRSTRLAVELARFRDVLWPTWKHQDAPPEKASELRSALFEAVRASPKKIPSSPRALHRIVTKSPSEMSHRPVQDAGVTTTRNLNMKQHQSSDTIEVIAEREWKNSPTLRAEFGDNFKTYAAYRRAESDGKVKILGAPAGLSVHIQLKQRKLR